MSKVLVTGRAGSGKTTVTQELLKRGYTAFDTDKVPELSSWVYSTTGETVRLEDCSIVDTALYKWLWDPTVLGELLRQNENIFVCGGADNDYVFDDLFDYHFVLDVSPRVQAIRIEHRTNNDYGKAMIPAVIEDQKCHMEMARQNHSIIVDANQPIECVVDDIMRQIT